MNSTSRSTLLFAVKLVLGFCLLAALLIWNNNWERVVDLFSNAELYYLVPFFAITIPLLGMSCLKWRLFLSESGVVIRLPRLFGLYLIGAFFNNFLPGMVGGDLVRGYVLGRQIESHPHSLASIFLERLTGLVALVSLGLAFFLFDANLRKEPVIGASMLLISGGCLALLCMLWKPHLASGLLRPLSTYSYVKKILPKITQFHDHVMYFSDKPSLVLKAMAYSFAFHLLTGVNVYLTCLLLNIPFSLLSAIVLTPIILIVSSIPLTVNGLGVWEWAFSFYMAQTGAPLDHGLAVALALRAKSILVSLIGGILFVAERTATKRSMEDA